jgi:hypothetical protein
MAELQQEPRNREGRPPREGRAPREGGSREGGAREGGRSEGRERDDRRMDRRFEGPPEIDLEKLISDPLYLDNQAHGVVEPA